MTYPLKHIPSTNIERGVSLENGIPRKSFEAIRKVLGIVNLIQITKEAKSWNKVNFRLWELNLPEKYVIWTVCLIDMITYLQLLKKKKNSYIRNPSDKALLNCVQHFRRKASWWWC